MRTPHGPLLQAAAIAILHEDIYAPASLIDILTEDGISAYASTLMAAAIHSHPTVIERGRAMAAEHIEMITMIAQSRDVGVARTTRVAATIAAATPGMLAWWCAEIVRLG